MDDLRVSLHCITAKACQGNGWQTTYADFREAEGRIRLRQRHLDGLGAQGPCLPGVGMTTMEEVCLISID